MNIFILDTDPVICAQYHCDRHVVKMILETAQILCTALSNVTGDTVVSAYKPTHRRHPCTVWAEDIRNWVWLRNLGYALCAEYTHRYGKIHKSHAIIESFRLPPLSLHTPKNWALAMPDQYKQDDAVASYRSYYQYKQQQFKMTWRNRKVPEWFEYQPVIEREVEPYVSDIEDLFLEARILEEKMDARGG